MSNAPRRRKEPKGAHAVRSRESEASWFRKTPSWRFSKADFSDVQWSPGALGDMLEKLGSFEGMTWAQVLNTSASHFIYAAKLCKRAQARLIDLQLDDEDGLYSLRLSGKRRLFGLIEDGVFYVVWYDAEHEVCPSAITNT